MPQNIFGALAFTGTQSFMYETWTGSTMQFQNLKFTPDAFSLKNLIFTEGDVEKFDLSKIYNTNIGERYGTSMLNGFKCGTVAWTDWNVLLDENGEPNHVDNFCFAPIMPIQNRQINI